MTFPHQCPDVPPHPPVPDAARPGLISHPALLWLVGVTVLIELVLQAADLGLIGSLRWRPLAYQYGAFWAGLLYDWQPNYAVQPALMFVSYGFLHSGLVHLVSNMIVLLILGHAVIARVGLRGFGMLYLVSTIGGGLGFGLLTSSPQPMVGASGALFGLVGAWNYWTWRDRRAAGAWTWPLWRALLILVLLNFAMWLALSGLLAWETHLGGFVAGWAGAALLWRFSLKN